MQTLESAKYLRSSGPAEDRWFDQFSYDSLARSLAETLVRTPARDLEEVRKGHHKYRVGGTIAAALVIPVFFALMFGIMALDDSPKKRTGPPQIVPLVTMFCTLTGVLTGGTWILMSHGFRQRFKRSKNLNATMNRIGGLKSLGQVDLPDQFTGQLPWFESEEDEIHGTKGIGVGTFDGLDVAITEGFQSVDPIMKMTDSHLLKSASYLVRKRSQALRRNELESLTVLRPLVDVPDMLIMQKGDVNAGYFTRALDGKGMVDQDQLPESDRRHIRVASANPSKAGKLVTPQLTRLLREMPTGFIQVAGGYCSVVTAQWEGSKPGAAPSTEEEIESNWKLATGIYRLLQATGSRPDDAASISESVAVPELPERPTWRKHSIPMLLFLFGSGIPAVLLGIAICFVSLQKLNHANNNANWPTTVATITESSIKESGESTKIYRPILKYSYTVEGQLFTNDEIQFGDETDLSWAKADVEEVLAPYPLGEEAEVYYHPTNPSVSVLQTGFNEKGKSMTQMMPFLGGFFVLGGLLFCGLGFLGQKID